MTTGYTETIRSLYKEEKLNVGENFSIFEQAELVTFFISQSQLDYEKPQMLNSQVKKPGMYALILLFLREQLLTQNNP